MIKCVAFDLDDTLIYLDIPVIDLLVQTFEEADLAGVTKDEFISSNQKVFESLHQDYLNQNILLSQFGILIWYELLKDLAIMPTPMLVNALYNTFFTKTINSIRIHKDASKVIKDLKSLGLKVCVISNGAFVERILKLEKVDLLSSVDLLISSDLSGKDKPASEPFELALKYLQLKKHEILYVGDNQREDIVGASNFGIASLLFAPKGETLKGISSITTLSEVLNHIDRKY